MSNILLPTSAVDVAHENEPQAHRLGVVTRHASRWPKKSYHDHNHEVLSSHWQLEIETTSSYQDNVFSFTCLICGLSTSIRYSHINGCPIRISIVTNNFQWRWPRWRSQTFAWMCRSVSAYFSIRPIFWHCVRYDNIRSFRCSKSVKYYYQDL